MDVSLVMPTWNGGPLLAQVLERIERQPGAARLERVAIDSGSSDGTVGLLRKHNFAVHSIPQYQFNHGATRDLGIEKTRGELVVLLVQDALPADERWLPELLGSFTAPAVGAAYCRQLPRADCNPLLEKRLLEWTAGKTEAVVQSIGSGAEYEALAPIERLQRCAFDNVASAVRRATWARYRFGRRRFGEDIAFGKQVVLGGESIVFQAKSAVIHSHNRTARDEGRRIYCDHQNLRDLFDLRVLPTREAFLRAIEWGRAEFPRQLPPGSPESLRRWALDYARWSAVGIFLGGNAPENLTGPRAALYKKVDEWMHRGI
jgi:rhamnosyltransferase